MSRVSLAAAVETARSLVPIALHRRRPLAVRAPLISPVIDVLAPEYGVTALDMMSAASWRTAGLRKPHHSLGPERLATELEGAHLVVLVDLEDWPASKLELARGCSGPVLALSMVRGDDNVARFRRNANVLDAIIVDALEGTVRV